MKHLLPFFLMAFSSCISELTTEPELPRNFISIEQTTGVLPDISKTYVEGIYYVGKGNDLLGQEVAVKWVGRRLCFYSRQDVVFSENAGGISGNKIIFDGYIRVVRSARGVTLALKIQPDDGADSLIAGKSPGKIIITGTTSEGEIMLVKVRKLYRSQKRFEIIAHRGGARNSERLGISENSLEMMKYAQTLGATGIEIDVRPTRDRKLIIFHDDTFSPRSVQGEYLLGKVEDFDLAQIKLFGRLIHGESIPTLEEALQTVIDRTNLNVVWIDVKDPSIVNEVVKAQHNAVDYAVIAGRNSLKIYLGIPDENVYGSYCNCSDKSTDILVEYSREVASQNDNCKIYAPRWTNGIPLHLNNIEIFVWTLDVQNFIADFMKSDNVNGILTNYPSLVCGMYSAGNP